MSKVQKSGIYKIECLSTKKIYVGMSIRIYNRWYQHKNQLRKNKHCNSYLQNSWNKYGEEQFKFSVLEELPKDSKILEQRELEWIKIFDSTNNDYGFNINHSTVTINHVSRNKGKDVKTRSKKLRYKEKVVQRLKHLKAYSFPELKEYTFDTIEELRQFLPQTANKFGDYGLISYLVTNNSKWGYLWTTQEDRGCVLLDKINTRLLSGEFTPQHLKGTTRNITGFKKKSEQLANWRSQHLSGKPRPKRRKPFILNGKHYSSIAELDITHHQFYKAKREGKVQYT